MDLKFSTQHSIQAEQPNPSQPVNWPISVSHRRLPSRQLHTSIQQVPLNSTSPKLRPYSIPHQTCSFCRLPHIRKWERHPSTCSGKSSWCHSWLLSLKSHIRPPVEHRGSTCKISPESTFWLSSPLLPPGPNSILLCLCWSPTSNPLAISGWF